MNEGPLNKFLIKNNLEHVTLFPSMKFSGGLLFKVRNFYYILKFLRRNKVKIIHTNDLRMHYFWIPFCVLLKIKHFWQQHSAYYSKKNILYSNFSHRILTVSEFCKKSFTNQMSKRAIVIKNIFSPVILNNFKIKNYNQKIVITFIGNNSRQKRLHIFLGIVEKLVSYYKEKILIVIVGNIENFNEIISSYDIKNIKHYKFSDEIFSILKSSSLLIAPSANEGFGRIIIESMLAETLVLASRSGGHKEIINENETGFLAELDCIDDFYESAIKILSLSLKEKNKIIRTAFKFAKTNFLQADTLENLLDTYKCQKKY